MPRPRKSKPVAEAAATNPSAEPQPGTGSAPETRSGPFAPGEAHEPPFAAPAGPDHTPPPGALVRVSAAREERPGRLAGISLDSRNGVRIDVERERRPGTPAPRVLIRFADDRPPSAEEKQILRAEGFAYAAGDKAWAAPLSAASLVVAKRAVNAITRGRGDIGAALYV